MQRMKKTGLVLLLWAFFVYPLFGDTADLLVSTGYDYGYSGDFGSSNSGNLQVSLFGSAPLPGTGNAQYGASLRASHPLISGEDVQDGEFLFGELFFPWQEVTLLVKGDLYSSLNDPVYSRYAEPSWEMEFAFPGRDSSEGDRFGLVPALAYSGSWIYQESGGDDRLANQLAASFSWLGASFRNYTVELRGESLYWFESYLLNESGVPTETRRSDLSVSLFGEAKGLAGYFLDWDLQVQGGIQLTNDNILSSDLGFYTLQALLSWSPVRKVNIRSNLYGEGRFWFHQMVEEEDGSLSDIPLQRHDLGCSLDGELTFNDRLYLLLGFSGELNLSNDPALQGWSVSISAGLEYSFFH